MSILQHRFGRAAAGRISAVVVALGMLFGAVPASAAIISWTTTGDFSGSTETIGSPTVTFNDFGSTGTVKMTIDLTAFTSSVGSAPFVPEVWFNFNGDATALNFSNLAGMGGNGVPNPAITTCNAGVACGNSFRPDGDGFFDVRMVFGTMAPRFDAGETFMMDIALANITAFSFSLNSLTGDGGGGIHCVAVRAQGLGSTADDSDFLGGPCDTVSAVPLPAALPLFLSALAGLGLMGWRRQAGA